MGKWFPAFLLFGLSLATSVFALPRKDIQDRTTAILVDKKNNTLRLAEYLINEGKYEVLKTYHTTVGKVVGDKIEQDDLKTPEGIYFFTARLRPPAIKPKFGSLALYMNYPNAYDRIAGRTGFDIMLHATNEPERLKKEFDSKGCIVVNNSEIEEINKQVDLQLTPIIVFDDLNSSYLSPGAPGSNDKLKGFFQSWLNSWSEKDIDRYMAAYHSEFRSDGKNKDGWRIYKNSLNHRYGKIRVGADAVRYFTHPKYSVVIFEQDYRSQFRNGRSAYTSYGTKFLYVAEEKGALKIIDERFTKSLLPPKQYRFK